MYRVYNRKAGGYVGTMTSWRIRRIVPAESAYIYQSLASIRNSLGHRVDNPDKPDRPVMAGNQRCFNCNGRYRLSRWFDHICTVYVQKGDTHATVRN